jgi:hypothetical protein
MKSPLLERISRGLGFGVGQVAPGKLSLDEIAALLRLDGLGIQNLGQSIIGNREPMEGDYVGLARGGMKSDAIVFACLAIRMNVLSEARFAFRDIQEDGRPGKLGTGPELDALAHPWPGATTGDLIARAEVYSSLGGNFYAARRPGNRIRPLRPDWTWIVIGVRDGDPETDDPWSIDAEIIGYQYQEGGPALGREPLNLLAEQVAHFAPKPDPEARFRGMSWLLPVIREIEADRAMTGHKLSFLDNGGTSNMVVKAEEPDLEKFQAWVKIFREQHEGVAKRYKTIFLQPGVDIDVIGSNLLEIDFKNVQGAGESRIAAAAGIHPALGGFSEGLQGSALNAGNFAEIRRNFGDVHARPWWRNLCGSLETIIDVPEQKELWYDARDIAFLSQNHKDAAEARKTDAETISTLFMAGYEPDSIIAAVAAEDWSLLAHTGVDSVQVQGARNSAATPSANGHSDRLPVITKETL